MNNMRSAEGVDPTTIRRSVMTKGTASVEFTPEELAIVRRINAARRATYIAKLTPEQVSAQAAKRTAYNKAHNQAVKSDPIKLAAMKVSQATYRANRAARIAADQAELTLLRKAMEVGA
jgi:hypothetical protein